MKKIKKTFLILAVLVAILVLTIISLEILSRVYKCKSFTPQMVCPHNIPVMNEKKRELLSELRNKRFAGEKISKQEYRYAAEELILDVSPDLLGGYVNGISCGDIGYVRNDLPDAAKKFVQRHELEHLLQTRGIIGKENFEFSANLAAGKEYPFGLIQTIFWSIEKRSKYYDSFSCLVSSLWKTFKVYFLP